MVSVHNSIVSQWIAALQAQGLAVRSSATQAVERAEYAVVVGASMQPQEPYEVGGEIEAELATLVYAQSYLAAATKVEQAFAALRDQCMQQGIIISLGEMTWYLDPALRDWYVVEARLYARWQE